jgi:hypothetical protein
MKYCLNQFDYDKKINNTKLQIDKEILTSWEEKAKHLKEKIDISKDLFE